MICAQCTITWAEDAIPLQPQWNTMLSDTLTNSLLKPLVGTVSEALLEVISSTVLALMKPEVHQALHAHHMHLGGLLPITVASWSMRLALHLKMCTRLQEILQSALEKSMKDRLAVGLKSLLCTAEPTPLRSTLFAVLWRDRVHLTVRNIARPVVWNIVWVSMWEALSVASGAPAIADANIPVAEQIESLNTPVNTALNLPTSTMDRDLLLQRTLAGKLLNFVTEDGMEMVIDVTVDAALCTCWDAA